MLILHRQVVVGELDQQVQKIRGGASEGGIGSSSYVHPTAAIL